MKNAYSKKLIAGNWKMNGDLASAKGLTAAIMDGIAQDPSLTDRCDFLIAPPFLHIPAVQEVTANGQGPVILAGQDCSDHDNGAFTGDISAMMLANCGVQAVILGHSERRQYHGESSQTVRKKAEKSRQAGLMTIICVGEDAAQRDSGAHFDIVGQQLAESLPDELAPEHIVIAYEPVWAIGTGKTATPEDVASMHAFIHERYEDLRILYGGSVKPDNAAALFSTENVDGALIGGASLQADQFLGIAKAVR